MSELNVPFWALGRQLMQDYPGKDSSLAAPAEGQRPAQVNKAEPGESREARDRGRTLPGGAPGAPR